MKAYSYILKLMTTFEPKHVSIKSMQKLISYNFTVYSSVLCKTQMRQIEYQIAVIRPKNKLFCIVVFDTLKL